MKNKPKISPAPLPATLELTIQAHEATPHYGDNSHPPVAPTEPVRPPDRRAAGGYVFDLHNEQTTL